MLETPCSHIFAIALKSVYMCLLKRISFAEWILFSFFCLIGYILFVRFGKQILIYPFTFTNGIPLIFPPAKRWQDSPCLKFSKATSPYEADVYGVHFGTNFVVIANSYSSVTHLWKRSMANNSRPFGHSFHSILSKKGIYTIGTTPHGEPYKRAKRHILDKTLSKKKTDHYNYAVMNDVCDLMINRLIMKDNNSIIYDDLTREAQYFHLSVALLVTYGFKLNPYDFNHIQLADRIIEVENKITKVRSHIQNPQDYFPTPIRIIWNWLENNNKKYNDLYKIREKYLNDFHNYAKNQYDDITRTKRYVDFSRGRTDEELKTRINEIEQSLMFSYFKDLEEVDKTKCKISHEEVTSECLTMVSAGLDNTPLNFKYGIHIMVNYKPEIWSKAYQQLLKYFGGDVQRAYKECASNTDCVYMSAIVKETLRLYTVLPMALPRKTTGAMVYHGLKIPSGSTLFMNCWAANHDERYFPNAMDFVPERWIETLVSESKAEFILDSRMDHFSFGSGCRKCLGNHFAFRELYILFSKMILQFEIIEQVYPDNVKPSSNPLELNQFPESLAIEPIPFNIHLRVRDWSKPCEYSDWESVQAT